MALTTAGRFRYMMLVAWVMRRVYRVNGEAAFDAWLWRIVV